MIKFQIIFLTAFTIFTGLVHADAGPPIPVPDIRIEEAISMSRDYLLNQWENPYERTSLSLDEFIIQRVVYTNFYRSEGSIDDEIQEIWIWLVTFIHPVANDHTMTFEIDPEGLISLYELTI